MRFLSVLLLFMSLITTANSAEFCADQGQSEKIAEYYAANPGKQPAIVAARLGLPEAIVASALDETQAVSAPGSAFAEVWQSMESWDMATFLVMKGGSVFEILSSIGEGKPSTQSQYFNIAYTQPMRGHLRPDEYASIYAVAVPVSEDVVSRGIIFYDANGDSVFGAFISGDSMETTPAEIAKFDALMTMIRDKPSVCP